MPRFLIEVPHEKEVAACARVVKVFLFSGSHFLAQADWGCIDGDHRAWIIANVADKEEALAIVPPAFRSVARIIGLNYFSMGYIDEILKHHDAMGS